MAKRGLNRAESPLKQAGGVKYVKCRMHHLQQIDSRAIAEVIITSCVMSDDE